MTSRTVTTSVVLAAFFAALCFWGIAAFNYGDEVAVGTYHFAQARVICELVLKPDHTFVQELKSGGNAARVEGTWRRVGEGGISFSNAFLAVPGALIEPDGTTFADMHKALGLFVTLRVRRYHVLLYGRTASQSGTSPVGRYDGDEEGVKATLTLHPDHSFEQEIIRPGVSAIAKGTWATGQNGAIRFSQAFLKTSGKPLEADESATADDPSGSNLQIMVANTSSFGEPVFRKKTPLW
jgi:hypothetical protein